MRRVRQKEEELEITLDNVQKGDEEAEKVLDRLYREFRQLCYKEAGHFDNDGVYHSFIALKDKWQEKVMEVHCAKNRSKLQSLRSQMNGISQQLEESNASNREMGSKLELLLTVIKETAELQQRMKEDKDSIKQQLEESIASNKEIRQKMEDLVSKNKTLSMKLEILTEDNARMKEQLKLSNTINKEIKEELEDFVATSIELEEKLIEDNALTEQKLEETNANNEKMREKFEELVAGNKMLKEKTECLVRDNARIKDQLEKSNTSFSEKYEYLMSKVSKMESLSEEMESHSANEPTTSGTGKSLFQSMGFSIRTFD